ncbi:MAG: hypothetical protein R3A52_21055 [Polyangiales bacterium]
MVDAAPAAPPFARRTSSPAAGDGRAITVEGATLVAPADERFGAWITLDLDGDGSATDVAATRLSADGATARGVGFWSRAGEGFTPVEVDAPPVLEARCTRSALRQESRRSLTVDWTCPADAPLADGGAPPAYTRVSSLMALGPRPAHRATAAIARGLTDDPELTVSVDGSDADGDGNDEVVLTARLGDAVFREVYFDRGGALARDLSEPAASIEHTLGLARRALARGRRGAPAALAVLSQFTRLRRHLCAEGGVARVRFRDALGVTCGGPAVFARAAETELRALLAMGETPGAWALTRPEFAGDDGPVSLTAVQRDLARASVPERGYTAAAGPFVGTPLDALAPGRRGALAFDLPVSPPAVMLNGVATGRVDLAALTFAPGPEGSLGSLFATTPEGARVLGLADSCRGLVAVVCPAGGACGDDVSLRAVPDGAERWGGGTLSSLATARRCASDVGFATPLSPREARVLGATRDGVLAAVRGRLYRVTRGATAPVWSGEALGAGFGAGGGVSANGRWAAVPGVEGVWVRDARGWKLRAPEALAGRTAQMTDLTITDDGAVVAGMVGTQVWVVRR